MTPTAPVTPPAAGGRPAAGPAVPTASGAGRPRVVAAAVVSHRDGTPELPVVPGFVASAFNPLVRETVRRCLGEPGTPESPNALVGPHPDSTAVVLTTVAGDATTSDLASQKLVSGRVHNPLLFFQSVTTSIVGHLCIEYGLTGAVNCIASDSGAGEAALEAAALLLRDATVDQVLVIGVELAANPRTEAAFAHLAARGSATEPPADDLAVALLLRRGGAAGPGVPPAGAGPREAGHLAGLASLAGTAGLAGTVRHSREEER
ncbi:beta-ketoacyl synthase N-terminal-like domain-containing protein [Streptomyces sp. NPDC048603]|uniref:beta-ketoacyl synthase N-terminal-like domain-containing protein n=1 Tax=Streptomyces sp. NPDC048603 TaxID=3365577 RepID=UPI003722A4F6